MESFAEGDNDFGLALYGELGPEPGNLFFSPFSIRAALGMTCGGARGETAAQMREALRFASAESPHEALGEVIRRLNAAGEGEYGTAIASSLWSQSQDGSPLRAEFLELVARHYDGGMNVVDFRRDAEAARGTINRWVEDKTKRKIRELIPAHGLHPETRLVLVNAIRFKGMWVLKFHQDSTSDQPFYLHGGGTVRVLLMYQHTEVRYLQAEGFQAVELDYQGGDLSMLVLLPDQKGGLRDIETRLSARMLHDCVERMGMAKVEIFLPRFKITWGSVEMSACLRSLGMSLAFTPQADFSGINGHPPPHEDSLFISAVFHQAFVEVNEEGTEAAAATAVPMFRSAPPVFRADHPFLFAIRDRKSGVILFLGRVADPTPES